MKLDADFILRASSLVAAAAILAAPYRQRIVGLVVQAAKAADAYRADLGRAGIAAVLVAAAWGVIPVPTAVNYTVPKVEVPTPSDSVQRVVQPIGAALRDASPADKATWAAVWLKGSKVIAHNDPADNDAKIANTAALRQVLVVALDVGWRRIGDHRAGEYAGLREAVEGALTKVIGTDQKELDAQTAAAAEELFRGIAWAGLHGG